SEQGEELAALRTQVAELSQLAGMYSAEAGDEPELAAFSQAKAFEDQRALQAIEMAARNGVLEQAFEQVPGLAELMQARQNAPADRSQEVQALLNQYVPDWGEYAIEVNTAMQRHPDLFDPQRVDAK